MRNLIYCRYEQLGDEKWFTRQYYSNPVEDMNCAYKVDDAELALPWFKEYMGKYISDDFSWSATQMWQTKEGRESLRIRIENAQKNLTHLSEQPKVATQEKIIRVEKTGQLWEKCECGNEPIYMPLHLCKKCWPAYEIGENL